MPYLLLTITGVLGLMSALQGSATEWPDFLGPNRDGTAPAARLVTTWGDQGPRELWRRDVGAGFSGPVVAEGRVVLFHRILNREIIEAFDALTGDSIWQYAYPTDYRDDFGFDEGPRAIPVISDGTVFTFGAQGMLHAIDLDTGERRWSINTMDRFGVPKGFFGQAGSPLVDDGKVIANIGGPNAGIVAFDANSGEVLWTATSHGASYSSPVAAEFGGRRYAIFLTRDGLVGLDPSTGEVRFERAWRSRSASSVNAASPVVLDDLIFVSAEYGPGAGLFRWNDDELTEIWTSNDVLTNHYTTSVHHEGVLYGYHGRQEFGPALRGVDLVTGEVQWSIEQFRAGSILVAGDQLVVVREGGELILAPASRRGFEPTAVAVVLPPTIRAYPALADGRLYLRNSSTIICLDLRM